MGITLRIENCRIAFVSTLRRLQRSKRFSLSCVCILSLGVAGAAITAGLVDALFLHPIAGADVSRTVELLGAASPPNRDRVGWWRQAHSLESVAQYRSGQVSLSSGDGQVLSPVVGIVSPKFFQVMGVSPSSNIGPRSLGRDEYLLYIGKRLLDSAFGNKHPDLGSQFRINGKIVTFAGIVPYAFSYPGRADAWIVDPSHSFPLSAEDAARSDIGPRLNAALIGRLRPGISPADAQAELRVLQIRLAGLYGRKSFGMPVSVRPLSEDVSRMIGGEYRTIVICGIVLSLLALFNAVGLTAIRWREKQPEIAVRLVCGATPAHICRLCVAEAAILAVGSGLVGTGVASISFIAIRRLLLHQIPSIVGLHLGPIPVSAAFVASVLAVLMMSMAAVSSVGKADGGNAIFTRAKLLGYRGSRRRFSWAGLQVALAFSLIGIALAGVTKVRNLEQAAVGFEMKDLSFVEAETHAPVNITPSEFAVIAEAMSRIPGVQSAALVDRAPLSVKFSRYEPVRSVAGKGEEAFGNLTEYAGDMITALGLQVVGPRLPCDDHRCVIINDYLAKHLGPRQLKSGDSIILPGENSPRIVEAVVHNVKSNALDDIPEAQFYLPYDHPYNNLGSKSFSIALRHAPSRSIADLRSRLAGIDSNLVVLGSVSGDDIAESTLRGDIARRGMLNAMAESATIIALFGVFVFLSHVILMKRSELALWQALGANRTRIIRWAVGTTVSCVTVGIIGGAGLLLFLIPLIANLLGFGVNISGEEMLIAALALEMLALPLGAVLSLIALISSPFELLKTQ